jgi:hypothetical protein
MTLKAAAPNDDWLRAALKGARLPAHSLDTMGVKSISGYALQNAVRPESVIGLPLGEILKATDWKPVCET